MAVRPARAAPLPTDDLRCDFVGGALGYRIRRGFGRKEPLARAVGFKPGSKPRIVDATAGLGRDAFLLASAGLDVVLIERVAAMHTRLADGLARAIEAGGEPAQAAARMTLLFGDARELLPGLCPEVVLVDPMHPDRGSTALVKKNMRQIRALVGDDGDALGLMEVALSAATERVVLKWPLRAEALAGLPPPHHRIDGQTLRFDVWLTRAAAG